MQITRYPGDFLSFRAQTQEPLGSPQVSDHAPGSGVQGHALKLHEADQYTFAVTDLWNINLPKKLIPV